ncbi:MAG: alpha/beta fold hydrolase [Bacteroidota bacterium]
MLNYHKKEDISLLINKDKLVDVGSAKLQCCIFGENRDNAIVIEAALASSSAEWWHIAEQLSQHAIVITYDRAGYGLSTLSKLARTPKNISKELYLLLTRLNIKNKVMIVGHSQGGLYAQQFSRDYPDKVKSLVLIDPLSANDNMFLELLTKEEYKKSGVDKTKGLQVGALLCRLQLGALLRPMLKKGIPFYYYKNFSEKAEKYILDSLTKYSHYKTALYEYNLAHCDDEVRHLKTKEGFPEIPITLITHDSTIVIDEIMKFGLASKELAIKIEGIWQELMKEYLTFSSVTKWFQAERSSHYIHLTDTKLVLESILEKI